MAFYSYLSTKIIIAFITKSYQDLFGVRSYINAKTRQLFRIAMMIKVDIPEPFIDGDNTMVNITSDSFCYSSIDSRYEGFQSSYKDGNMNQKIQGKLEIIADQFKELIKIIEDGKTFVNTGV